MAKSFKQWETSRFLIAPFPDLCLLVLFFINVVTLVYLGSIFVSD